MNQTLQVVLILGIALIFIFIVTTECGRNMFTINSLPTFSLPQGQVASETAMGIFTDTRAYFNSSLSSTAQEIHFVNGVASYEVAPGSVAKGIVKVIPGTIFEAEGYVVAVMSVTEGGTGTFYYLVALTERNGVFVQGSNFFLGDRIDIVKATTNKKGQVVLTTNERGPSDSMSQPPRIQMTSVYELANGQLYIVPQS